MKNRLLLSLGLVALASGSYLRAGFDSELNTLKEQHEAVKAINKNVQEMGWGYESAAQANDDLFKELKKFKKKHDTKATKNKTFRRMNRNLKKWNETLMSLGFIAPASESHLRASFNSELKTLREKYNEVKNDVKITKTEGWGHMQMQTSIKITNLLAEFVNLEEQYDAKTKRSERFKSMKADLEMWNTELTSLTFR